MVDHFIKELKEKESLLDTRLIEWVKKIHPANQYVRKNFTDPNYESQILNKNNKMAAYRKNLVSDILGKSQTTSSVSSPAKIKRTWISKSKSGKEVIKQREMEIIQQIKFDANSNPSSLLQTGLHSYKGIAEIASHTKIYANMPETLIFGYGFESPTLLYTNEEGVLQVQQRLLPPQIDILIQILETWRFSNHSGVVCPLCIIIAPNSQFNRILMRESELKYEIKNAHKTDLIVQRYVLPKGRKSCKIRIVWTNKEIKVYKITNIERLDGKKEHNPLDSVYYYTKVNDIRKKYGNDRVPLTNHIKVSVKNQEQYNKALENVEILIMNEKTHEMRIKSMTHLNDQKTKDLEKLEFDYDISDDKTKKFSSKFLDTSMGFYDHFKWDHSSTPKVPIKPSSAIYAEKNADEDLISYIKESIPSSPPQISLKKLYHSLSKVTRNEDEEDFPFDGSQLSNYFANKLRNMYCTDFSNPEKSVIYEMKTLKSYDKAIKQLHEIRKGINSSLLSKENQRLSQLVLDFAEDEFNNFYFLKIKAFQCEQKIHKSLQLKGKNLNFICQGEHCSNLISDSQSDSFNIPGDQDKSGKFMILRGAMIDDKNEEKELSKMLNPRLYERVPVCRNCYKTYTLKDKGNLSQYQKAVRAAKHKEMKQKQIDDLLEEINPQAAPKISENLAHSFLLKRSESMPFRNQTATLKRDFSQPKLRPKIRKRKTVKSTPSSTKSSFLKKKMIEINNITSELGFLDSSHLNKTSVI
ncbi:unnamed protein product [Blepharisma stoltei]|uniref:Uncharacterized protein n=1 Tax=Blepharisma stoltei TaxID=1481888 RepID=A0AAU9I828_9CILI|nr:unnamed protein product [Blepharisma stoltei]